MYFCKTIAIFLRHLSYLFAFNKYGMVIFNYWALRKYIVCQGFYLTSRLETVRTRSGHLGWDATLSWTRRRNFSTSCLTENSSSFLDIRTKFKPLLRTDFSALESGRFSGIVTTVLRLSIDDSRVLEGPVNSSSLWALIWCKWLKSLELTSWILVRIDCTKIAGQILDSSERHCRICLSRSSRFWHIALIVILIILREKEFWAHWIWRRYWLEWESEDAWKLERKPLGITLEWSNGRWIWCDYKT